MKQAGRDVDQARTTVPAAPKDRGAAVGAEVAGHAGAGCIGTQILCDLTMERVGKECGEGLEVLCRRDASGCVSSRRSSTADPDVALGYERPRLDLEAGHQAARLTRASTRQITSRVGNINWLGMVGYAPWTQPPLHIGGVGGGGVAVGDHEVWEVAVR